MSPGVHTPRLWSLEEMTSRVTDAPVEKQKGLTEDLLQQCKDGALVNPDIQLTLTCNILALIYTKSAS